LLIHAKPRKAAGIHICVGAPVLFRVGGQLVGVVKERLDAKKSKELSGHKGMFYVKPACFSFRTSAKQRDFMRY